MAEPIDAIVPILQRIQGDICGLDRKVDQANETLVRHSEKLEAIEGYLKYHLGLTSRNTAGIGALKSEIDEIRKRVDALEPR